MVCVVWNPSASMPSIVECDIASRICASGGTWKTRNTVPPAGVSSTAVPYCGSTTASRPSAGSVSHTSAHASPPNASPSDRKMDRPSSSIPVTTLRTPMDDLPSRFRSAQRAEARAHVVDEELGLLHRGEVSAARHLGPVHEVVVVLDPGARRPDDLAREDRGTGRHVDVSGAGGV